jgi:hypothetical protein
MSASLEYVNKLTEALLRYMQRTFLTVEDHKVSHRAPYAVYDSANWDQSRWDDPGDLGAAWDEASYEDSMWDQEEEISVDLVL